MEVMRSGGIPYVFWNKFGGANLFELDEGHVK